MSKQKSEFWRELSLYQMSSEQWESVCDGCGKCCLQQLEDEVSEQLVFTNVVCDLLDTSSCRCTDYENRSIRVPSCMTMTPENVAECVEFAPPSCAYRLLIQGDELPDWHHLRSGSRQVIHHSGRSVFGKVVRHAEVDEDDLEEHIVTWPESVN